MKYVGIIAPRQQRSTHCLQRMPDCFVRKYFGKDRIEDPSPEQATRMTKFLAGQFEVEPSEVKLAADGRILLSQRAYCRMQKVPLKDDSFFEDGGTGRSAYEMAEMAYNDVMSGSVQASGESMAGLARKGIEGLVELGGEKVKSAVDTLSRSGLTEVLTGAGAGLTAGLGVWLLRSGGKQFAQGLARDDQQQICEGARGLFLGTESMAATLALASQLGDAALLKVLGGVASKAALPLALIHGTTDVVQGGNKIIEGLEQKDALDVVEGVADLGMGAGWLSVAFSPTPEAVVTSCVCLATKMGVAVVRKRRRNRDINEFQRAGADFAREALDPNRAQDSPKVLVMEPQSPPTFTARRGGMLELDLPDKT